MNIRINKKHKFKSGIASLPILLVIGVMALAIVVSITSIALNELFISQGQAQSSKALFYAEGGARDALVRIARDKNYSCISTDCYSVDFITNGCTSNTDCAKVTVSGGIGTTADPKIITSKGIMRNSIRKMQVNVILDNGAAEIVNQKGLITGTTWSEITN